MSDDAFIISRNITIVPAHDSECLVPSSINTQDLSEYYDTISLPVVQSKSIYDDQYADAIMLFGSWIESGDEDKYLEELYESRLASSK